MSLYFEEIPYPSDPARLFQSVANQRGSIFFDSAQGSLNWGDETGRYSFFSHSPQLILSSKGDSIWTDQDDSNHKFDGMNIFNVIQSILKEYSIAHNPNLPPWQGGWAGFFSYDLLQKLENIPLAQQDDMNFPDVCVGLYSTVVAIDHHKKEAFVIGSGYDYKNSNASIQERQVKAQTDVRAFRSLLLDMPLLMPNLPEIPVIDVNFTDKTYPAQVQKIIDYIYEGDIYQANLTRRWKAEIPPNYDLWGLYCHIRAQNPAPFAAFLNFDPIWILSTSPERFLSVRDHHVETRPIKGTRKRHGNNSLLDAELKEELSNSLKDRSENIMIVDVLRNDLSRVCIPGTVHTPKLLDIEEYETVFHLVSTVTGQLDPIYDAIDLLKATFPGGSITGAPKIRAMEIISELEPTRRGPYCGCIGYIGFSGAMDTNIVIRTFCINGNILTLQAGGGIVVDSNPIDEYIETQTKAHALLHALKGKY